MQHVVPLGQQGILGLRNEELPRTRNEQRLAVHAVCLFKTSTRDVHLPVGHVLGHGVASVRSALALGAFTYPGLQPRQHASARIRSLTAHADGVPDGLTGRPGSCLKTVIDPLIEDG